MLARVHAIKGTPVPRAAPPAGWLPPAAPQLSDADAADELLAAAADSIALSGSTRGGGASYDDATLAALATAPRCSRGSSSTEQPLLAPSRAELRGLGRDAASVLHEVKGYEGAGVPAIGVPVGAARTLPTAYGFGADDDDDDDDDDDEEEAARLLEQLQDELVFEEREAKVAVSAAALKPPPAPMAGFVLPSAPTHNVVGAPPRAGGATAAVATTCVSTPLSDDEQDRWCSICTEDAAVWCADCDHEPYCARCWREGHAEEDLRTHRVVKIVAGRRRPR